MKKASVFQRALPLLAFFLMCLLTACSSNQPSNLLVGTWLSDYNEIVVFEKDGSYERAETEEEALDDKYTYFVSKDTLIIEGDTYTKSE